MSFIYNNKDIKERRVKLFVNNLHRSFTNMMLLDKEAAELIDEDAEKAYIASLSYVDGETFPVLPLGNELVFQFDSLNLDFNSNSKFIFEEPTGQNLQDVLGLQYATEEEDLPEGYTRLSNGLVIYGGEVVFKNLDVYQYDYKSYEILSEMYQAVEVFFASVESFYSNFYADEPEGSDNIILVYDTADIDAELENVIYPIADTITDVTNRELVKERYKLLRDQIKFWSMSRVVRIDGEIDRLLYCINATKKYSVQQNIETKQLELIVDENGNNRRIHKDEEIFFPFHNKPSLDQFTLGLQGLY